MKNTFKILLLILLVVLVACSTKHKSCQSEKECLKEFKSNLKAEKTSLAFDFYKNYVFFKEEEDYCLLLDLSIQVSKNLYQGKTIQSGTKETLTFIDNIYNKAGLPIISEKIKVKETLQGINEQNKMLKLLAALNLYQANQQKYMDNILSSLKDKSPEIRGSALVVIGYTRDKKYIPYVKKVYKNDPVIFVRQYALKALGYLDPENYKTDLEKEILSETPLSKTMAAGCLLSYKNKEALKIIKESLDSKNELIVARALEGLAEAGTMIDEDKVISLLDCNSAIVSYRAAQAIGNSKNPEYIRILKRKLNNDEDPASKLVVAIALLMLDDLSGIDDIKQGLTSNNVIVNIFASQAIIDYCSRNQLCKK